MASAQAPSLSAIAFCDLITPRFFSDLSNLTARSRHRCRLLQAFDESGCLLISPCMFLAGNAGFRRGCGVADLGRRTEMAS